MIYCWLNQRAEQIQSMNFFYLNMPLKISFRKTAMGKNVDVCFFNGIIIFFLNLDAIFFKHSMIFNG